MTILQKEALPMIRYRIGDITVMDDETCAVRTNPSENPAVSRAGSMIC